jgi:hypothetical protein
MLSITSVVHHLLTFSLCYLVSSVYMRYQIIIIKKKIKRLSIGFRYAFILQILFSCNYAQTLNMRTCNVHGLLVVCIHLSSATIATPSLAVKNKFTPLFKYSF